MPLAFTSTSTSPAFGPSSRTVSIDKGWPALWATAARVSMSLSGCNAADGPHLCGRDARGPDYVDDACTMSTCDRPYSSNGAEVTRKPRVSYNGARLVCAVSVTARSG